MGIFFYEEGFVDGRVLVIFLELLRARQVFLYVRV